MDTRDFIREFQDLPRNDRIICAGMIGAGLALFVLALLLAFNGGAYE